MRKNRSSQFQFSSQGFKEHGTSNVKTEQEFIIVIYMFFFFSAAGVLFPIKVGKTGKQYYFYSVVDVVVALALAVIIINTFLSFGL